MHSVFWNFADRLSESNDAAAIRACMADAIAALDINYFAYLSMPRKSNAEPHIITTYPSNWTMHYLRNHYERIDPVIANALSNPEPFEWGPDIESRRLSGFQRKLFDEALEFGIRTGFSVPIHDGRDTVVAVTFTSNERKIATFRRGVDEYRRALQLMAMYFHAHVRRKLAPDRVAGGVALSPREFECLEWAARGKSAWEIRQILGISKHTAATHLENAKAKFGVRTIIQVVARLAASGMFVQ